MEISAATVLAYSVGVPVDPANPCGFTLADIELTVPVTVIWILPPGYQFGAAGITGLGEPDFFDGRFDAFSRRRFRWTARRGGSQGWRTYSFTIEWMDAQGGLHSCVSPDLKIVNRS
jgi:hypothetical protein